MHAEVAQSWPRAGGMAGICELFHVDDLLFGLLLLQVENGKKEGQGVGVHGGDGEPVDSARECAPAIQIAGRGCGPVANAEGGM